MKRNTLLAIEGVRAATRAARYGTPLYVYSATRIAANYARLAGAYGFSMSSTYGGRPRPAEVLVSGKRHALIRRGGAFADLLRGQIVPFRPRV